MEREIDLTDKSYWSLENVAVIAKYFGYSPDDNFKEALQEFIEQIVREAEITMYLATLALGFFARWQPPLEKCGKKGQSF